MGVDDSTKLYTPAGYCPRCGYAVDPGACPECGAHAKRPRRQKPGGWKRRALVAAIVVTVLGPATWHWGPTALARVLPASILTELSYSWAHDEFTRRFAARQRAIERELARAADPPAWAGIYTSPHSLPSTELLLAEHGGFTH